MNSGVCIHVITECGVYVKVILNKLNILDYSEYYIAMYVYRISSFYNNIIIIIIIIITNLTVIITN